MERVRSLPYEEKRKVGASVPTFIFGARTYIVNKNWGRLRPMCWYLVFREKWISSFRLKNSVLPAMQCFNFGILSKPYFPSKLRYALEIRCAMAHHRPCGWCGIVVTYKWTSITTTKVFYPSFLRGNDGTFAEILSRGYHLISRRTRSRKEYCIIYGIKQLAPGLLYFFLAKEDYRVLDSIARK